MSKYLKITSIFLSVYIISMAHAEPMNDTQKNEINRVLLEMERLSQQSSNVTTGKDSKSKNSVFKQNSNAIGELKLSRVDQIAVSGKYIKKKEIKKAPKLVINKKSETSKQPQPQGKSQKKKKSSKRQLSYCLGGSYKALSDKSKKYDKYISKYGEQYDVPKALIKAVITAESCFNAKAVSAKGAQGLMQLMPPTAKRFGINDSFDPAYNIKGGTRYLKFLLKYFDEDLLYAIAAYNAGEGAVEKYKGIPPYKETKLYVRKVAALYKLYTQGGGELTSPSIASLQDADLKKSIFVPRALPKSRFSPYKGRIRNIAHGQCANRTSTRLRKSTKVESGSGIWQRVYVAQKGDTLLRVMQKTGVHKNKIKQMNGLSSRTRLKVGQELLVWECRK